MPDSVSKPLVVDVHTHTYPPKYVDLLASRSTVPYIHKPDNSDPRLIILASDDDASRPMEARGRPIDASYSSWDEKRKFMSLHGIDVSVVSLANPWLDFVEPDIALETAQGINDDMNDACAENNKSGASCKLFTFGCLPLSAPSAQITAEIERLKSLSHTKGVIMGTTGLGSGLDDAEMSPIWAALASTGTIVFLHPHYGLPDAAFGGPETIAKSGHVLPLALGFPLETTIAIARMYLAGVFDQHPKLTMLLAHSGGTLPFLAGRIQSCVDHEREFIANGGSKKGPKRDIWDVLKTNIYLDAVIYGKPGLKAAIEAGGTDRVMFGTDHPFFPPLNEKDGKWLSVESNREAIGSAGDDTVEAILGGNAVRVLGLGV
jgi:predicted TIM-barrel fold metal-dependent hydrolase